jgi:hypothetical protein
VYAFPKLFLGVTPSPIRAYLTDELAKKVREYPILHSPCTGRFTVPQIAIEVGYKPENIYTSDISLFSSVIGYSFTGKDLQDLRVEYHAPELEFLESYAGTDRHGGAIMFGICWCQNRVRSYYEQTYRDEMERDPERHIDELQNDIDEYKRVFAKAHYSQADLFDVVTEECRDSQNLIYVSPPNVSGGYAKMFDFGESISWDEPAISEFLPGKGDAKLQSEVRDSEALVLMTQWGQLADDWKSRAVFGMEFPGGKMAYVLCNRPGECEKKVAPRPRLDVNDGGFSLLSEDHEITPKSNIVFMPTTADVALYYRDLFAHRLGATRSESYFVALLDGFLFGTLALHLHKTRIGQTRDVFESFRMTSPNRKYTRLNRLLVACIVSEQFKRVVEYYEPTLIPLRVTGVSTVCIAQHQSVMTNRGLFKLTKKERMPNGMWHLNYRTAWKPWDFRGAVNTWCQKHAKFGDPNYGGGGE